MAVTIGIDPHKGSHTAVALDDQEVTLATLRVRTGTEKLARRSALSRDPVDNQNVYSIMVIMRRLGIPLRRGCYRQARVIVTCRQSLWPPDRARSRYRMAIMVCTAEP